MYEYREKDLCRDWIRVFDLPIAQVAVAKDADDFGQKTVSITFHSAKFGTMSLHHWPAENETVDELFEDFTKDESKVTQALASVLAEMNLLSERAEEARNNVD